MRVLAVMGQERAYEKALRRGHGTRSYVRSVGVVILTTKNPSKSLKIMNNLMTGANVSTVGLFLDIVGALLLWRYVVEIDFVEKDEFLKGNAVLTPADPTPEEIRSYKRRIVISRIGVAFLVIGFSLQVVGNYVP